MRSIAQLQVDGVYCSASIGGVYFLKFDGSIAAFKWDYFVGLRVLGSLHLRW